MKQKIVSDFYAELIDLDYSLYRKTIEAAGAVCLSLDLSTKQASEVEKSFVYHTLRVKRGEI
jgi:hypothetical protein